MATVTGLTAEAMQAIRDSVIVSGHVLIDNLILVAHDGTEINAGNVRGANATAGARWVNSTAYVVGSTVGFAGRVWACIQANTGKAPGFNAGYWVPVNGAGVDVWAQSDPLFMSDTLADWETFWTSGAITRSYGTAVGEFETGEKSLKLAMGASSSQRLYEKLENIVNGGEKVQISVRAKLSAAATGATLDALLLQAPSTGTPIPFGTGSTTVASAEGSKTLTTAWQTFVFTMTTVVGKPRATANVVFSQSAAGASTILVDSIKVIRGTEVAQNQRLDAIETLNTTQNGRLTTLEGTELAAAINLNTKTTPGIFWQSDVAEATLLLNYPVATSGVLEVLSNGTNRIWQRYTTHSDGGATFYMRTYDGTTWGAWKKYNAEDDTGWVTAASAGWTGVSGQCSLTGGIVRRRNGMVAVQLTGLLAVAKAAGNIANFSAWNMPPGGAWTPAQSNGQIGAGSTGGDFSAYASAADVIQVSNIGTAMAVGDTLQGMGVYML